MDSKRIFSISSEEEFKNISLEVFQFQYENNLVYRNFCKFLKVIPSEVDQLEKIPFLPIQFFKSDKILSSDSSVEKIFTSSGTTGSATSKHYITHLSVYEESFRKGFQHFYGDIRDYVVLALLPSYLEREGSSLIYMAQDLIEKSNDSNSGFYLNNLEELSKILRRLDKSATKKILLIGVSFALLDLAEKNQFQLKNTIIMETGGMKGRRKEMIREELHQLLKNGFGSTSIHSEYGMTELLSQAYSKGNGVFECPSWMKILIRDPEDALTYVEPGKTGGMNIIDLANINSCSFIATQDLGKVVDKNSVEILGRFDNSDIRGCNLLVL